MEFSRGKNTLVNMDWSKWYIHCAGEFAKKNTGAYIHTQPHTWDDETNPSTTSPIMEFLKCSFFLQRMHLVKGDVYYHPNSPKHSLKENKRIGEIPILWARTHESDRTTHDHERTTAGSYISIYNIYYQILNHLLGWCGYYSPIPRYV